MSSAPLSFFTIDHGTASTSAALIGPFDGRFRLLASSTVPCGVDLDALLEDLVLRVEAVEPGLLDGSDRWREWTRLESATRPPRRVLCIGASERAIADLERTFAASGWELTGRIIASRLDPLASMESCLDPRSSTLAIASPALDDGFTMRSRLAPLVAAVMLKRPEVPVLLCGSSDGWPGLPDGSLIRLPQAEHLPASTASGLRDALATVRLPPPTEPWEAAVPPAGPVDADLPDGRETMRAAVGTLAGLLDRRIQAVDIGHSGAARTMAHPDGVVGHVVSAAAALVPTGVLHDERQAEEITRWSALRADPFMLADRFRNLRLAPWRELAGDGARLRLAALRAALSRLDLQWREPGRRQPSTDADMLICAGGAFAAVPPPAAALAVVDGMRRTGAVTMFHDHARLLGPIGALPDAGDRRRLLVDLLDDVLLPLGSAIVVGELRAGARVAATLRVTSYLQQLDLELAPDTLRLVDLPPGVSARVEVETRDGAPLGVRARHIALDVTGGLGGLLVDTREVPLRLPERAERRRAMLEAWERPVWGSDA